MDAKAALETAVLAYKGREKLPDDVLKQEFYSVNDLFGSDPFHCYWTSQLRADRFADDPRILYRPSIADAIVSRIDKCFMASGKKGLMIKGPQGIGKSHSIINVYRKLVSSTQNNYLVTFIPFCEDWNNTDFFANAVCRSLGLELADIGLQDDDLSSPEISIVAVRKLLKLIQDLLKKHGLKWVFIFDQINSLFSKAPQAEKLEELPDPYFLVSEVMSSHFVVSVIAASANNEIAYKDRHQKFVEYHHPPSLGVGELPAFVEHITAGPDFMQADVKKQKRSESDDDDDDDKMDAKEQETSESDGDDEEMEDSAGKALLESLRRTSGGVPLYTITYLQNPVDFEVAVNEEVMHSLMKLRDALVKVEERRWEMVKDSILTMLLGIPTTALLYDRKYMTRETVGNGMVVYHALFPAIASAFRRLLWKELMMFVEESEVRLLTICQDPTTTNDTRGRIFESIVIRRMQSEQTDVELPDGERFSIPKENIQTISGSAFPLPKADGTALIIPVNLNFPAVDWIWVNGSSIYGVQCHVNPHDDVFAKFVANAKKSKWFQRFDKVSLVYFSPERETVSLVVNRVSPEEMDVPLGRAQRGSDALPKLRICQTKRDFNLISVVCE